MDNYKNLIDNMPLLYMQEKLIVNEQGVADDLIYLNVNPHFEKHFSVERMSSVSGPVNCFLNLYLNFYTSSRSP